MQSYVTLWNGFETIDIDYKRVEINNAEHSVAINISKTYYYHDRHFYYYYYYY